MTASAMAAARGLVSMLRKIELNSQTKDSQNQFIRRYPTLTLRLMKYFVDGPRAQHLLGPIQQGVDIGFIDTLAIGIREFLTELCLQ
uniref:Uncharacterized protein n=1 Tax=Candidatus Kentrum sp. LPFa TaxID=2126335 RepID=A0A450WEL5_9GAMM|nr:MAG: hypothetical protein BECKLPF1236A_GA0070988_101276 [Candidatus Kentron sp. LPFa]VFK30755.1 MAG: hypothetical protein BECKLPF1236C_GA0070990_101197 [Candidatus Kentron sp. LPFa]